MLEYWCGHKKDYKHPKCVNFTSKLDTDLYDFVKNKTYPSDLTVSPDGKQFATLGTDRKVCDPPFLFSDLLIFR